MGNSNTIEIRLEVKDDGSVVVKKFADESVGSLGRIKGQGDVLGHSMKALTDQLLALGAAYFGIRGMANLGRSFLEAATISEEYRIRLVALMRTTEEADKIFEAMNEYAARTPFELREIMGAATALSGIMKGGSAQIASWMPLIGDLAATTGLSIDVATQQVMRMLSAGAASADLFRERGVLAMLGFQAGVNYSAQETGKRLIEAWTKADSQFRGATDQLAHTWKGTLSMFSDEWYQFRNMVMENDAFGSLKQTSQEFLGVIKRFEEEGTLRTWAEIIGRSLGTVTGLVKDATVYWTDFFNIASAKHLAEINEEIAKYQKWVAESEALQGKKVLGLFPYAGVDPAIVARLNDLLRERNEILVHMAALAPKTALPQSSAASSPLIAGLAGTAENAKKAAEAIKELEQMWKDYEHTLSLSGLGGDLGAGVGKWTEYQKNALKVIDEQNKAVSYIHVHYGEYVDNSIDQLQRLEMAVRQVGSHFTDSIVSMCMTGKASFKDMIDAMISDLLRFEIQTKLTEPMFAGMSAWMGGFFAPSYPAPVPGVFDAKGDAWLNGKIVPYARGDVVYGPTVFPMAQGWGLMGEAGPEGVLPLARTSSGDLGVKSAGGGQPVNIVNNFYVSAVDGESVARFFQRYSRQVSNALETELRAGNRSLRGMIRRTT